MKQARVGGVMWLCTICLMTTMILETQARRCEPIRVSTCRNIGYNVTGMPNLARHTMQADADVTMQTFAPLLQYGCSSQLKLFLCSVYVPMCTEQVALPIGPCRSLCEGVYRRCFPVLKGFGFPWPAEFNCSQFPAENNHEHMCMEGPGEETVQKVSPPTVPIVFGDPNVECHKYAKSTNYVFLDRTGRCAQFCDAEILYDFTDKRLAEVWLSIWTALCFVSTLCAMLTVLLRTLKYPERPLLFMALCHNLASVGWGVRVIAGHGAVSCTRDAQTPTRTILSQDGLANPNCAVVFLLLYYFGMAACVWWVILAGAWRSRVARRAAGLLPPSSSPLSSSSDKKGGPPLQLIGWGLPAIQTVVVLVLRDVDADELTGTCFVGNQSTSSLMSLVIVPQLIYLGVGCIFLLLGFKTLLTKQAHPPLQPQSLAHNMHVRKDMAEEVNLSRLGTFAVMYIVPTAYIISSWFYEYFSRESWLAASRPSPAPTVAPRPAIWVMLLRILMLQILGVMTSVWVISAKGMHPWKRLFGRMGPPAYKPAPVKPIPVHYYAAPSLVHTMPKRSHSHGKYSTTHSHGSYRKPRSHHSHPYPLPGGETML